MVTYAELQAEVFAALGLRDAAEQELVSAAAVRRALAEVHRWLAAQTGMYVREAALPVAAGQGRVPLPADVVDVAEAALSGRVPPLVRVSAREAAEPRAGMAWYRDQGRTLGLAPAPAAAEPAADGRDIEDAVREVLGPREPPGDGAEPVFAEPEAPLASAPAREAP